MMVSGLGFFLIGCAAFPDARTVYGPPRFGSLAKQAFPRIVSFRERPNAPWQSGLWLDKGVVVPIASKPVPSAQDWQEYKKTTAAFAAGSRAKNLMTVPVDQIAAQKLLGIPFVPARIIGVALNHIEHMRDLGFSDADIQKFHEDPPRFFWKKTQPIGPFDPIVIPVKHSPETFRFDSVTLDYEVEIGMVVGKKIRRGDINDKTDLSDVLAGFVLANDLSDREPQIWAIADPGETDEGTSHWPRTGKKKPWNRHVFDLFAEGKSHPTFAVLGPFLVSPESYRILYSGSLQLWRRAPKDGCFDRKQNGLVMHYQHSPQRLLAAALEDPYLNIQELLPGDVILMGTPAGTVLKGSDLQRLMPRDLLYPLYRAESPLLGYLKPGDELWAESDILGFQDNVIQHSPSQ